jgi:proline iminopeptidase
MYAHLNDLQIFFERLGQGQPLLMMHGGPGLDHTIFRPWLDQLAEQVDLIYYDHRGNGRSTRPASMERVTHETWAVDADMLRSYLGFEKIILFDHSYGGFLAQEYALRFGHRLVGLILCSTAPVFDYMPIVQANAAARGTPDALVALSEVFGRAMNDDSDLRSIWMRLLPLYFVRYDPVIGSAMDEKTWYSAAAWNQASANGLPKFNTLPRLKEIKAPTLILGGSDDWLTPAEQSRRLYDELPNAELVLFENSGHFPYIEETDKFVATVRRWLARLENKTVLAALPGLR